MKLRLTAAIFALSAVSTFGLAQSNSNTQGSGTQNGSGMDSNSSAMDSANAGQISRHHKSRKSHSKADGQVVGDQSDPSKRASRPTHGLGQTDGSTMDENGGQNGGLALTDIGGTGTDGAVPSNSVATGRASAPTEPRPDRQMVPETSAPSTASVTPNSGSDAPQR